MMTDQIAQESARPAWATRDHLDDPVVSELNRQFGPDAFTIQPTRTGMPVVWVKREQFLKVITFLKKLPKPYVMLFDLHGVDERQRLTEKACRQLTFRCFIISFLLSVIATSC